jgi:hypothetical protein
VTEPPDDPYASPPAGAQPPPRYGAPPPPPGYGAPPPPYGAPPQPYGAPPPYGAAPQPYGAPPPPYGAPPQPYGAPYGAPYGQHAPGYLPSGYPPPSTTNGYAIASLACSIVLVVVAGIGSILGVVFGIIGLRQCGRKNERGKGLAIAGIVIGGIGILFWLLALLGFIIDANSSDDTPSNNIGAHATVQLPIGQPNAAIRSSP